jgi:hypothetical protein
MAHPMKRGRAASLKPFYIDAVPTLHLHLRLWQK